MLDINHFAICASGKERVPCRDPRKIRRCLICNKVLSMYNLNRYCFVHSLRGAISDLRNQDERRAARAKRYVVKAREKYNAKHHNISKKKAREK